MIDNIDYSQEQAQLDALMPTIKPLAERGHTEEKFGVSFTPILESDLEMVRLWRNAPHIRQQMTTTEIIHADQQKKWFSGLVNDKSRDYALVFFRNEPIGVGNLIFTEEGIASSGLYIYPEKYLSSVVAFCISLAGLEFTFNRKDLIVDKINIHIKLSNKKALRFNKSLGFEITSEDQEYHHLEITREKFLISKEKISKSVNLIYQSIV